VDDPPSSRTDDEDEDEDEDDDDDDMTLDEALFGPDFWSAYDPAAGSPTVYPPTGNSSDETVRPPDTRPRIRPGNLVGRPVSIPELPVQDLTQMRPATAGPQAEPEGRDGQGRSPEGQLSSGGTRSVSPDTASNFPLYTEYLRVRAASPQLSLTSSGDMGSL